MVNLHKLTQANDLKIKTLFLNDLKQETFLYDIDVIKHMVNATDKVDKVNVALKKLRDERLTKLYAEIVKTIPNKDFELMVDQVQELITRTKLKLTHHELTAITDSFYKLEEPTRNRLDLADKFFIEIDHANSQIVQGKDSVGLFYT